MSFQIITYFVCVCVYVWELVEKSNLFSFILLSMTA